TFSETDSVIVVLCAGFQSGSSHRTAERGRSTRPVLFDSQDFDPLIGFEANCPRFSEIGNILCRTGPRPVHSQAVGIGARFTPLWSLDNSWVHHPSERHR